MATGGGSYSFSLTTFSPSGKLVQIEHALAAVGQGTSSLGIKATNGVVIATEKKTASILVDDSVIEKVATICPNIGMVYSGMGPDYRVLVTRARKIAQSYWKIYGEYPPTRLLTQEIATVMQEATQSGGVRPFGVSLLIAGWDEHRGSTLYQVDPSGSFWPWKASAIGKNMVNAKSFLEKRYNDDLSLEDAIHTAILTLKEGFEGQMTENTIEIGVMGTVGVGADTVQPAARSKPVFRKLTEAEVKDFLALWFFSPPSTLAHLLWNIKMIRQAGQRATLFWIFISGCEVPLKWSSFQIILTEKIAEMLKTLDWPPIAHLLNLDANYGRDNGI